MLVYLYSNIKMIHGPIRLSREVILPHPVYSFTCFDHTIILREHTLFLAKVIV